MDKSRRWNSEPRLRQGNKRLEKQPYRPKSSSNSIPRGITSTATDDDLLRYHPRSQSMNRVPATPIKKLLAEEMTRETMSRKRSPGLIARLMGLDSLPPQQSSHEQQKRFVEDCGGSTEKTRKNGLFSSGRFSRKNSEDEREFKDVFEVVDVPKRESRYYSPVSANSELSESEVEFNRRKFMDAKWLSADGKFYGSKEFDEVIQDPDSNKDLPPKYLDQPDSFSKHLHNLQGAQLYYPVSHLSARKSSSVTERKAPSRSRRKTNDAAFNLTSAKQTGHGHHNCSKTHVERKDESTVIPTRIVILKPNFGRLQNACINDLSPRSSYDFLSDCEQHAELLGIKKKEVGRSAVKRSYGHEGSPRYQSKESREVVKQISRQKRSALPDGSINFFASKSKGYVGDESSTNCSENESVFELEVKSHTSRNLMEWSNCDRSSSSRSTESSLSREARRRLSERWKMTHKSIDLGMISGGSTLGEMLSIPDKEVGPENAAEVVGVARLGRNLDAINGPAGWVEPLGISSVDGWKGECTTDLPISGSLPSSSATISSPRTEMHDRALYDDSYLIPREAIQQERNTFVKANLSQKNGSSFKNCRSHGRKSHIPWTACNEYGDTSPDLCFSQNPMQSGITENDPVQQYTEVFGTSTDITMDDILTTESFKDVIENPETPSQLAYSVYASAQGSSFSIDLGATQETMDSPLQEGSLDVQIPMDERESSVSSKEADHPSPVSVLETPPDDVSSGTDCFGSVSADLHGLRMQLQLLKLESEEYAEGPMIVSSDEEVEYGSDEISDQGELGEESKEVSYVGNLLLNSRIDDADLDSYAASCYSLECPVSPEVFDELEKNYYGNASWPRSERKLLFDRMNMALFTIYRKSADPHPWTRAKSKIGSGWIRNGLQDALQKMFFSQNMDASNIILGHAEWLDMGEDIDVIGREIERLLIEELITELVL